MKVSLEERQAFKQRYNELIQKGGVSKTQAIGVIADEFDRGRTTVWDNLHIVDEDEEVLDLSPFKVSDGVEVVEKVNTTSMPSLEYKQAGKHSTYILTGWEIRVGVNENFIGCLEKLAENLNAKLMVTPIWYKDVNFIPERITRSFDVVTENLKFNENLVFEYIPTHALVQSALTGWSGSFPSKTAILPGLIKELTTEPSNMQSKQLMTTGSIGYLNADYKQYEYINPDQDLEVHGDFVRRWNNVSNKAHGRTTAIAQKFIVPSALIIDIIDDKTFLTRYVTMTEEGVIYDLNKKITLNNVTETRPLGLVTGDYHAWTMDEQTHQANKEMMVEFKPYKTILNDTFDGQSVNHHELGNSIHFSKAPSIEEEAEKTKEVIKELAELGELVYMHSNHDDFVEKYLHRGEQYWRMNNNLAISYELQAYRIRTDKHPIIKLLDLDNIKNLEFSHAKENYYIADNLIIHGHESYARMGFKGFSRVYNNLVMGHEHKPQVYRNSVCVGSTATRDQSYSIGANASMGANCLIHQDGNLQLIPIINGVWKK